MSFEVFTQPSTSRRKGATVTINVNGDFSLSAESFKLLAEPTHVELLFDKETQTVAFRAAGADSLSAYPVRRPAKSFLVSCTAFARSHGIDTSESRRWPARQEDGMLQFVLTAESAPVTGNRKKRAPAE